MISSVSVFANEAGLLAFKPESQRNLYKPQGFWSFFGMGLGAPDLKGANGIPLQTKFLGSYYFDESPLVADMSLGLHDQFYTGSRSKSDLYTEIAGRYIFTNRWQLGALWDTLVDNPRQYRSNNDNLASFVGAQALKEFSLKDNYLVRVGGRATTSVGLSGGSVNSIMAELEVSFPSNTQNNAVKSDAR